MTSQPTLWVVKKDWSKVGFGTRLEHARVLRGFPSRNAVGVAIGMESGPTSRLFNDQRPVAKRAATTINGLARVLEVDPGWLTNGLGPEPTPLGNGTPAPRHEPAPPSPRTSAPQAEAPGRLVDGRWRDFAKLHPGFRVQATLALAAKVVDDFVLDVASDELLASGSSPTQEEARKAILAARNGANEWTELVSRNPGTPSAHEMSGSRGSSTRK